MSVHVHQSVQGRSQAHEHEYAEAHSHSIDIDALPEIPQSEEGQPDIPVFGAQEPDFDSNPAIAVETPPEPEPETLSDLDASLEDEQE